MAEESKPKLNKTAKLKSGAKKTTRLVHKGVKTRAFRYLLVVAAIGLVGYGIFVAGEHRGAKHQEAIDAKKRSTQFANRPPSQAAKLPNGQTRKSVFGTITKVSDKSIDIKAKTGGATSTVIIDKNTTVTSYDGKKQDTKSLKNDQSVIVSGIADKDGKITAQRIRIQKQ